MKPSNSFSADKFLADALKKREEHNALRMLRPDSNLVDFCSNDYLGFAKSEELKTAIEKEFKSYPRSWNGSTGSRLLAGNSDYAEQLEKQIATFHNAEAGLIFNSGYDANVGLFSAILQKGDTIIYDKLIHASMHDGINISKASVFMFPHNDIEYLRERLALSQGTIYVAVESIYSMDGDAGKLKEILDLCKKYNANLIVDEAHATGVIGKDGKGMVQELGIEKDVFARVHTFGKALGCHGAIVLGSNLLRDFLINFSRSFIYTTALPVQSLMAVNQAYQLLQRSEEEIKKLKELIYYFKNNVSKIRKIQLVYSNSPIQCIIVGGNNETKQLANMIAGEGYDVRPILSPTVQKGKERLRICIHTYNTKEEIDGLIKAINSYL